VTTEDELRRGFRVSSIVDAAREAHERIAALESEQRGLDGAFREAGHRIAELQREQSALRESVEELAGAVGDLERDWKLKPLRRADLELSEDELRAAGRALRAEAGPGPGAEPRELPPERELVEPPPGTRKESPQGLLSAAAALVATAIERATGEQRARLSGFAAAAFAAIPVAGPVGGDAELVRLLLGASLRVAGLSATSQDRADLARRIGLQGPALSVIEQLAHEGGGGYEAATRKSGNEGGSR
jgi:hypothetical protein